MVKCLFTKNSTFFLNKHVTKKANLKCNKIFILFTQKDPTIQITQLKNCSSLLISIERKKIKQNIYLQEVYNTICTFYLKKKNEKAKAMSVYTPLSTTTSQSSHQQQKSKSYGKPNNFSIVCCSEENV